MEAVSERIHTAKEIAYILGKASTAGNGWSCRCPAHDDRDPSLSVSDGDDGKLLAYCHSGCSFEDIARALKSNGIGFSRGRNIERKVIRFQPSNANNKLPLSVGSKIRGCPIVSRWDYTTEEGEYLFSKYRTQAPDGKKSYSILPTQKQLEEAGHSLVLYNLTGLKEARENDRLVYLCEGEKCADAVSELGLIATSPPVGATKGDTGSKWREKYNQSLAGLHVVIFADNDEAGVNFAEAVAHKLYNVAASVKVVKFPELEEAGDVFDYLKNHSREDLLARVDESCVFVPDQEIKRFELNEFGNGRRLAHYSAGRIKFCSKFDDWLSFNGKVWKLDTVLAEKLAKEVIQLISKEEQFHTTEREEKAFQRFLQISHKASGIKNILFCGRSEPNMQVSIEELDKPPVPLFNANNGTIDLRTGSIRPHSKDDLLTKISSVDYDPKATAPRWEQFLEEVFNGDTQLIEWIQCLLGYVMTGEASLRLFAVLYGSGRNGKSTLVETTSRILGEDYSMGIPTQTLYAKKVESNTTPELARLRGARLVYASEGEEGKRLNTAAVKNFTGDEQITVRPLYAEPFNFKPQFTILFSTNHKPEVPDTTDSIWDRVKLIPFNRRFKDHEVDPNLKKKFLDESSGILNWLVQGAMKYYQLGMVLPPCEAITEATKGYRSDSDLVQRFLGEKADCGPHYETQIGSLHGEFVKWCSEEQGDSEALSLPKFRDRLKEKGFQIRAGHANKKFFVGIRIKQEPDNVSI